MIRYAITDLSRAAAKPEKRLEAMLGAARQWISSGIDVVQLREKALPAGEVLQLAEAFLSARRGLGGSTRLLINSRIDIAVAAGADGVHLTSAHGELTAEQVRDVFARAGLAKPMVSVSCHSLADVARARETGVDLILFGPVFEKVVGGVALADGSGLEMLSQAVRMAGDVPVLALGGVMVLNAAACVEAGSAGVAAIRMFG